MTDKTDKRIESITALKNANKHLEELFAEMHKKDETLRYQADQISYAAKQCGDLKVNVYVGQSRQDVSLKLFLETAVIALNGARS